MAEIEVARGDGVQTLRLNRPEKKNALTDGMYHALADALAAGEADGAVAAHLILGQPGVFTAGNDIADFLSGRGTGGVGRFLMALVDLAKPLVAGVDGAAIGVGATLLLHCDLVIASPRTVIATPFVDLGLLPENASSLLAPRIMGHPWAFELLCLGEPFGAERAREARILNRIVAEDAVERVATELARRLAAKPAGALREARALLRGDVEAVRTRSLAESAAFTARLGSPEAQAAFAAFLARGTAR